MVHRACVRRLQVEWLKCQTFESLVKNSPLGVNSACSNGISSNTLIRKNGQASPSIEGSKTGHVRKS